MGLLMFAGFLLFAGSFAAPGIYTSISSESFTSSTKTASLSLFYILCYILYIGCYI